MHIEKIRLPNGVRIVAERLPYVRSATMGIWFGCGSRYENSRINGISHYIEHMMFKGTNAHTAAQLAERMDELGGGFNAFTTKECTSYYFRALDTNMLESAKLLCELVFESTFDEREMELERGVIFEEIDMYEDTPDELASERLISGVFKGSPLGMPILGRKTTLEKMTGDTLREYMSKYYTAGNTVVAISGNFGNDVIEYLKNRLSQLPINKTVKPKKAEYQQVNTTKKKRIEQNHICIGFPGYSYDDGDRYAMQLFNNILGGGMSSRLFRTIREENGLCYSVYTYTASHADTGMCGIYMALNPQSQEKALKLTQDVLNKLLEDGVTEKELNRAKEQCRSSILMGLESTATRMNHMARSELLMGEIADPDEVIGRYDAVDRDTLRDTARKYYDLDKMSISIVGNI